jgi:hypothetical protein
MWEGLIAGAGGLLSLYVALRREVRRSYEFLDKDIGHVIDRLNRADARTDGIERRMDAGFADVRADLRRLDGKIDAARGELIGLLGPR